VNSLARILIVDDERFHLNVMADLLGDEYKIIVAKSGERALKIAASETPPDLILLDVLMPEMDGYEVCRQLKANGITQHIPVMFLTVKGDVADETHGLSLGAVDYITKPFSPPIVKARVKTHLALTQALSALEEQNECLEHAVEERTLEVVRTQDVAIYCLASLAETRDNETGNHLRRTQYYVKALAEKLKTHPEFAPTLTDEAITLIYKSAPLHDIGKVGVPDRVLLKPGKLGSEEWQEMLKHPTHGRDAINRAEKDLGSTSFLNFAREIVYTHHEKWDGSGYPRGIKGDEIPISGRLMALSDVYDALISKRVYKPPFSHEKAVGIIVKGRGTHFDPDVVDAFLEIEPQFIDIAQRFEDEI